MKKDFILKSIIVIICFIIVVSCAIISNNLDKKAIERCQEQGYSYGYCVEHLK